MLILVRIASSFVLRIFYFPPLYFIMTKNRDKLYIHTRQYVNKRTPVSADYAALIFYRPNVWASCGIYGDFVSVPHKTEAAPGTKKRDARASRIAALIFHSAYSSALMFFSISSSST